MINKEKIKKVLSEEPSFRTKQVYDSIYKNFVESWDEAKNLPKDLREKLEKECSLKIDAKIVSSKNKKTLKATINLEDGIIETVLIKHGGDRNTICVSSAIGCSLGCDFCATGKLGFTRNLMAGEIVDQVLLFARILKKENKRITNIVFMGMGEPLLNYEEVMKAIRVMNDKEGINIGARKISISTVGIIEGIKKIEKEKLQFNLAVSLHFADDNARSRYIPINKKYSIAKLLQAINFYINKTGRKVMIEYVMLAGINDSEKDAEKLAILLKNNIDKLFIVNLISYNETSDYKSSSQQKIDKFKEILEKKKIETIQRYKFGETIKAACGQLAGVK